MKIHKQLFTLSALVSLALSCSSALAQENQAPYLADQTQSHPALEQQYLALVQPLVEQSPWLSHYGTTSPGVAVQLDNKPYTVYWGCKPHNCISESYALLVDASNQLLAGGFIRNTFDGPKVSHSNITWLGDTQWDFAKVLIQHLY